MSALFQTDSSKVRFYQRLVLAAVIFPHGAQKLFGWFGGYGFEGTMGYLTGTVGMPALLALLVILAESVGALLLAAGALSRLTALGIASVMVGAAVLVHLPHGFFMDWGGTQTGEGFEYHLLALALALPLVIKGGGAHSVDALIASRLAKRGSALSPARSNA